MQTTAAKMTDTVHPFEKRGLGVAPFRFVGMAQQDRLYGEVILNREEYQRTGVALTTKPGGTCAYCGTAITNMYDIVSSDGKRFHVGCECVMKTGDSKLVASVKVAVKRAEKAKRLVKAASVRAEVKALLADETARAKFAAVPRQWGSLLDYAEWMMPRRSVTGMARLLKMLKAAL